MGLFCHLFLNICVIFASFHEDGAVPVLYEFWNITNKDGAMDLANSTSTLELILSDPGDLLILRYFSFFKITSEEKMNCWLFVKFRCSGKSHSESDSLVNILLNWFAKVFALVNSLSTKSSLSLSFVLCRLAIGVQIFSFDLRIYKTF